MGIARVPATGAYHPDLPSQSLKAAPDTRPHCLILEATIAARSAVTVRSEPAHLEMACSVEPQPPLGLMKRGPTLPNSHFPSPGCAPAGFHGSNRSFVCFSRKTMTEIVQGSSISLKFLVLEPQFLFYIFLPGAESSLYLHISELLRCGRRLAVGYLPSPPAIWELASSPQKHTGEGCHQDAH